jgi:methyl-accepting chemotaxis protein
MKGRMKQMVREAPGEKEELVEESGADFWAGKTACWQMCNCPSAIKDDCPASKYTSVPCWEIEGTYCKLQKKGNAVTGTDTSVCETCRVYKKYGSDKPIELKLFGRGIDTSILKKT